MQPPPCLYTYPAARARPQVRGGAGAPSGGHIWITFRGDGDTCSGTGCNVGRDENLNRVFIHYMQPMASIEDSKLTTEKWYNLASGESYSVPNSGMTIKVCRITGDVATVGVGSSAADASGRCAGAPAAAQPAQSWADWFTSFFYPSSPGSSRSGD